MAHLRQYAGPHDAASIQVADGLFVSVLNRAVDDENVEALGYTLDDTTDPALGLQFVRRTITVSDHLDRALPEDVWPRVGGTADPDSIVDDPASNPVTSRAVLDEELGNDPLPTPAEVSERDKRDALAAHENRIKELDNAKAERDERVEPLEAREGELTETEGAELDELRKAARRDDAVRAEVTAEIERINGNG